MHGKNRKISFATGAFFVNSCLIDNSRFVREKKVEAKSVWLTARDFLRVKKFERSKNCPSAARRRAAQRMGRSTGSHYQVILGPPRKVSEDADSDIDLSGVQTVDSKVERPLPDRKSSGHAPTAKPRIITPEEQQANEHAFAQREQQRQERIEEREANQPSPPSMDEQEREAAREERRKAIEQRKA